MLSVLTYSNGVYAEDCLALIKSLITSVDKKVATNLEMDKHLDHRNFIAQFAKKNKIPVFLKQNGAGTEIPVVLLNAKTAPLLDKLLENSFGTQVALQKNYNNDHGLLRAGKYIIDLDSPGARGYGEIEKTGLAWKNIDNYLPHRNTNSSPTLEVAYLLTPNEKSIVDYYHKVRRAALFRVKFTFGGHNGPDYPNLLNYGGEHCFIFCKAEAVVDQVYEIKTRLINSGIKDPDALLKKATKAIDEVQKNINLTDPDELFSQMLNEKKILDLFKEFYPTKAVSGKDKLDIVNWIISYDSSKKYARVVNDLGLTGDLGVDDAANTRASVIFVYDEGADVSKFTNATYSNSGKMVSWPNTKQYPVK